MRLDNTDMSRLLADLAKTLEKHGGALTVRDGKVAIFCQYGCGYVEETRTSFMEMRDGEPYLGEREDVVSRSARFRVNVCWVGRRCNLDILRNGPDGWMKDHALSSTNRSEAQARRMVARLKTLFPTAEFEVHGLST